MYCVEQINTMEIMEPLKTETRGSKTVSRRSARLITEGKDWVEGRVTGQVECGPRHMSEERPENPQRTNLSLNNIEGPIFPFEDFGVDFCGNFPSTPEDIREHCTQHQAFLHINH
jgi:hypothetical protein